MKDNFLLLIIIISNKRLKYY